jgi:hypothetical protein
MAILHRWLWEKAGFTLAVCVLVGVVCAYVVPIVSLPIALVEIALAIVVVVKEVRPIA